MVRSGATATAAPRGATGRTWERRPAARRGELLDAAEHLFAERGVAAVTVADITTAAGVSKGSFYGYFASRDELVEALNERLGEELFSVLEDVLAALADSGVAELVDAAPRTVADRLRALLELSVERTIHALVARRDLIAVWSREPAVIGRSAEWLPRFVERLAPWVAAGDGTVVRCVDPTTTALLVVHAIFGVVLQAIVAGGDLDVDGLVASSQELATRAFGLA